MVKPYPNAMECPICYTNAPTYVINCGSTVEHTVCDTCEVTMRMKEPATAAGRVLKCPMCRVPEKVSGKRTSFSYEYELSMLYAVPAAPVAPVRVPVRENEWSRIARTVREMSPELQLQYVRRFPQLQPYLDVYNPVIDLIRQPHRMAAAAAIARAERQPFAAQVAPENQEAMRTPRPAQYHAFCQSGRRETGDCPTRGKTERKCTHAGCNKFVCRACRQCLTH